MFYYFRVHKKILQMIFNSSNSLLLYRAFTSQILSKTLTTLPQPKIRYIDPMETWEIAKEEVNKGDPQQGGEKAWLALDVRMREMAKQDGKIVLNTHFIKNRFIELYQIDYAEKYGPEEAKAIGVHYGLAQCLHANFYDGLLGPANVKDYLEHVKELIEKLQKFRLPVHRYPQLEEICLEKGYIGDNYDGENNRIFRWPGPEERKKLKQERKSQKQE